MSSNGAAAWNVEASWDITYQHVADAVTTEFLETLREEGRLLGRRCTSCGRVLLPPAAVCDRDFAPTEEWVELPLRGKLEMATVVYRPVTGLPEPPNALAYVLVDGADTPIPVRLEGLDLDSPERLRSELRPGREVRLELAGERRGRASDIMALLA